MRVDGEWEPEQGTGNRDSEPGPLVASAARGHLPRHWSQCSPFRFPVPVSRFPATALSSPIPLRPRSASEIVDAALQLYRRDPLTYLLLAALCYAPVLALQLAIIGPATRIEEQLSRLTAGFSLIMVFGYWVSLSLMLRGERELALYTSAAAEELVAGRQAVLERMRRAGVTVLDVSPQAMTAAVVNKYLEIKSRGAL